MIMLKDLPVSGMQNKDASEDDNVKGFTRISGSQEKEESKSDKIKSFTRISNRKNIIKNFSRIAGIAAGFIMIFIFVEFFYTGEGEQKGPGDFAYVDVDINPSITFVLDESGMVNEVTLLNDSDDFAIQEMDLDGRYFVDAFEMVVQKLKDERDFEEKMAILISAALNVENSIANEEKLSKQLLSAKDSLDKFGGNISIRGIIVDKDIRNKALENNVSMGRYAVYLGVNRQLDMSLDLIAEKTVHELFEIIDDNKVNLDAKIIIDTDLINLTPTPEETAPSIETMKPILSPTPPLAEVTTPESTPTSTPAVRAPAPSPVPTTALVPTKTPAATLAPKPTSTPVKEVTPTSVPTPVTTTENMASPTPEHTPRETATPAPTSMPTTTPVTTPIPTAAPSAHQRCPNANCNTSANCNINTGANCNINTNINTNVNTKTNTNVDTCTDASTNANSRADKWKCIGRLGRWKKWVDSSKSTYIK